MLTKLNRDTKENLVKWEIISSRPSSLSGNEVLTDNVYTCMVLDRKIRMYKFQSKIYYDEGAYEWSDGYRLEFIDNEGNSEWGITNDSAIYDLYETVRYKTSDIESFMDKYLKDEKKEVDPFDF